MRLSSEYHNLWEEDKEGCDGAAIGVALAKAPEVAGEFHMAGKFVTSIHWNSSSSAEAVNALFDEAKKKALEHVHVDNS